MAGSLSAYGVSGASARFAYVTTTGSTMVGVEAKVREDEEEEVVGRGGGEGVDEVTAPYLTATPLLLVGLPTDAFTLDSRAPTAAAAAECVAAVVFTYVRDRAILTSERC